MSNPRNYKLNLEKILKLENNKFIYLREMYDNMLHFCRDYQNGESDDMYLSYLNTLKNSGYMTYSKMENNKEYEVNKNIKKRSKKIEDLLDD